MDHLVSDRRQEMRVTTEAQLSAETEDSANNVKRRICEFLRKIKKSAKTRDIPNGHLTPTCGALIHLVNQQQGATQEGLQFLPDHDPQEFASFIQS
jgi:hypothetical protein